VGHLDCVHSLAIVNSAAINAGVQVLLLQPDIHFFGYIPNSGITGSYGRSICSFLRSLHIVFHSGCMSLRSHQQCMRVPFSPYPHPHLLLLVFLMVAILTRVRWNLSMVLICISFMARDGEHLFMCFLTIWTSSFEDVQFSSVVHFFIWVTDFWGV
jgi:hypothetical protein